MEAVGMRSGEVFRPVDETVEDVLSVVGENDRADDDYSFENRTIDDGVPDGIIRDVWIGHDLSDLWEGQIPPAATKPPRVLQR